METVAQMQTNFLGPMRIMQAVLPGMRKRRSGVIMNISSTQGLCPSQACGVYAASKAALEAISEACSAEVAPFGIRILVVEPGAFRTNFSNPDSAKYIKPSEEYAGNHIVGQRLEQVQRLPELAMGDPNKAARVMYEAATGKGEVGSLIKREGLLRIIVGPDSWKRIDQKITELRRTADLLEGVAASTNM
jgi:short-subunit dehydrogenase